MIVLPDGHKFDPATGLCSGCHLPYPCPMTRAWLIAAYGRGPALAIWAGAAMTEAAGALPNLGAKELWRRFLAWTDYT